MISKKTVALYAPPGHEYPKKEFYSSLFFRLNTFLMFVFPLNSIIREQVKGDLLFLLPCQILINGILAKLGHHFMDASSKFVLTHSQASGSSRSFGADNGAVNEREGAAIMAQFPNFHSPYLLYALALLIPLVLEAVPRGLDALFPENTTFPGNAFCEATCTSEDNQGGIRFWLQPGMALGLMIWNRGSDHHIKSVRIDAPEQCPPADLPEYQGNVIAPRVQTAINAIMTSVPIALYFKGQLLDRATAIELSGEGTRLFRDVGVFSYALPLVYLGLSKKNWEGIFPTGEFGWGLYDVSTDQEGALRYQPIAKAIDTKDRMTYFRTLGSMLSAWAGAIVIDEALLSSHDHEPPMVPSQYANLIVFSWFIIHQLMVLKAETTTHPT